MSLAIHAVLLLGGTGTEVPTIGGSLESAGIQIRLTSDAQATVPQVRGLETLPSILPEIVPRAPKYRALLPFVPGSIETRGLDESAYAVAGRLTSRPYAIDDIAIPYPPGSLHAGPVTAQMLLFINEDGKVDEIRLIGRGMPDEFVVAAKNAFLQARFRPGFMGQVAVKSRMTVEVEFDGGGSNS